jgi:fatty acid desaturase
MTITATHPQLVATLSQHLNPPPSKMLTRAYLLLSPFRFTQFALALTVCGLYGVDLRAATLFGKQSNSKWVYAEVVGGLSAVTAVIYMIPFLTTITWMFMWDTILFFHWTVLFGIFGEIYIKEIADGDQSVQRMKNAVWVDFGSALLWLITAAVMAWRLWRERRERTTFTGRGRNHF